MVLLLRVCEQLIEAPIQIVMNFVYLKFYDPKGCDDDMNLIEIWETNKSFMAKLDESYHKNCVFKLVRH